MNFDTDFEKYTIRIFRDKLPTAWARYADGERMILENSPVGYGTQAFNVDKWNYNNHLIFRKDLEETLHNTDDNYFYAISCKCCDYNGFVYYNNKIENRNKSYANLWINANYSKFSNIISNINEDVIVIANHEGEFNNYPFNVKKYLPIPDNVCNYYNEHKNEFLDKLVEFCDFENMLVFVSAGPLSEIIIHNLWNKNKTNRYIDVGSSIDNYIHGKITRPYMIEGTEYYGKRCD